MSPVSGLVSRVLRQSIFAVDRIQQRRHGVYEFEDDPLCILRISRVTCRVRRVLSDGAVVLPGDQVIEIHFWNERMPRMSQDGPDMSWGIQFTGRFRQSLRLLQRHMEADPSYDDIVAVFGESSFAGSMGWDRYESVFRCLGFDFHLNGSRSTAQRVAGLFVHLYVWTIVWVLNPATLRGRLFRTAQRGEMWISREGMRRHYARRRTRGTAPAEPSIAARECVGQIADRPLPASANRGPDYTPPLDPVPSPTGSLRPAA